MTRSRYELSIGMYEEKSRRTGIGGLATSAYSFENYLFDTACPTTKVVGTELLRQPRQPKLAAKYM